MISALKYGIVSEVKPGFARVYFEDDDIVSPWWPVISKTSLKDKESWPLNVQEHVACICDARLEEGVILGSIHSEADPADSGAGSGKFRTVFEDGTVIEYDKGTHKLTADVKGSVNVTASADIEATTTTSIKAMATVKATIQAPDIQLIGNVTVTGIISAGGISAAPMAGVPGANGKITAAADIETTGQVTAANVTAGTVSLLTHIHSNVQPGGGTSGPPVP